MLGLPLLLGPLPRFGPSGSPFSIRSILASWHVASIATLIMLAASGARGASESAPLSPAARAHLAEVLQLARTNRLAKQRQWLRLGRWQRGWFGGYSSQIDGSGFFLASNGNTDPAAELEATIRGLFYTQPERAQASTSREDTPPSTEKTEKEGPKPSPQIVCRYPARFVWLHTQLRFDLSLLVVPNCPAYQHYLKRAAARSVTLVFSSYFFNNPASMFGHTFLRLNKGTPGPVTEKRQELLDSGIDFSADVNTKNPIVYSLRGLFGLFPGTFKLLPYYYKVREYNDFEARDLWEYELNLSPQALYMLLAHLWELGSTYFDYFYMTENCSYHILGVIEAADPNLRLLEHVPKATVPADTIKALFRNPGLVRQVRFRPSVRSQFKARIEGLSRANRRLVKRLARDPKTPLPPSLGQAARIEVLDAAADLVDMRFAKELTVETGGEADQLKQQLLERRAAIALPSDELHVPQPPGETPETGHGSRRAAVGVGLRGEDEVFQTVEFRLTLHDLADPVGGYPELSQIEFFTGRMRFRYGANAVRMDNALFVRAVTLNPITQFDTKTSWKLEVGAVTIEDNGCDYCVAGRAIFGSGGTLSFWQDALTIYTTVDIHFAGSPNLGGIAGSPIRLGFGPAGGVRVRLSPRLIGLASGHWIWLPGQAPTSTWQGDMVLRWALSSRLAWGFQARVGERAFEGQIRTLFYF